ncbi:hypothetical protein ACH5RR_020865 [Cinchona calisaya]|uniref:Uncharacterized protein n=1 Tax=Cinchona calisaya TaxID=153742 RepID=A0ABD2ZHH9_9GENT
MASICISNCVDARAPIRATYVNLYKWPESDVEFVRSLSYNERRNGNMQRPKVVDSISCRQLYLRSYTFSRDDDEFNVDKQRKRSCARFKERVASGNQRKRKLMRGGGGGRSSSSSQHQGGDGDGGGGGGGRRKKCTGFRRAKEISCIALAAVFRKLLSCTTKVDVVG